MLLLRPAFFRGLLTALFVCATVSMPTLAQTTLEAPRGGWKHSGGESANHMQDVNYPASRVNAGGRRYTGDGFAAGSAIRGRIAGAPKGEPQQLIVNGTAMPLLIDDAGYFARPYSFTSGSNSVEVRTSDGKQTRRVNFFDANPNRQKIGLRIVLSWDTNMTDLDLHVVSPDGEHVFYANRVGKNGGALDVDVTSGFGPEIYAIPSPPHGIWQIYLNYYGGGSYGGQFGSEITIAQIAIISNEGTPDERQENFRIPMRRAGELSLIKSFMFP